MVGVDEFEQFARCCFGEYFAVDFFIKIDDFNLGVSVLVDGCKECLVGYGVVKGLSLCGDDADGFEWVEDVSGSV